MIKIILSRLNISFMRFAYHLVLGPVGEEPRGGEVGGAPHQLLYNNPPLSLYTLYTRIWPSDCDPKGLPTDNHKWVPMVLLRRS